jgi:hypothetical protein
LPIVLLPTTVEEGKAVGVVREGDAAYEEYRTCVDRVTERGYARFPV